MKKYLKLIAPVSGALLLAALLGPTSPAAAESGVPCVGPLPCSDAFDVSGAPEFWVVPDHLTEIDLRVAAGSGGDFTGDGGAGGYVWATVPVEAGDRLAFIVGDQGQSVLEGHLGGFGGGGNGNGNAGAGGGGSFVFIESGGAWEPLLIAGGGGGGSLGASGGNGGFSGSGPDADPATGSHAAGATTSGPGYIGGTVASFDGMTLTPGSGRDGNSGSGGGGGGYYGGGTQTGYFGGGGGSGFAAPGIDIVGEGETIGPGSIEVSYTNVQSTGAELEVQSSDPVVGKPITLRGTITQFDFDGGYGTATFSASLGAEQKFVEDIPVVIVDAGSGPFKTTVETTFVPSVAGEYTFSLSFASEDGEHFDARASDVTLTVGDAPVPPTKKVDELADTGANSPGSVALGAFGAVLLGAGAILALTRRRTRH